MTRHLQTALDATHLERDACLHCGRDIAGLAIDLAEDGRCCESCYLDRNKHDTKAFAHAYEGFAEALAEALDLREHETGLHSKRVACHTLVLARRFISEPAQLRRVYWGALLHDIGKIGIPDAVLLKEGPLDEAEWTLMHRHPETGSQILAPMPAFDESARIILCHEERYDGSGYPAGLRGGEIPLGARLFAVIDALDAMTNDRPYRSALNFDAAKAEIVRMSGSQFDPLAVAAFLAEETTLRNMVALKCTAVSIPAMVPGNATVSINSGEHDADTRPFNP
ncbi:MAG: HD-GYP domain-containing protein [Rhodocyclaceae bacterium]|nr:HD-GYP domain-containing protein [Rhodocyclaceae bacterium]